MKQENTCKSAELIRLSEAAKIRQGYQFRSRIVAEPDGNISVIQMADIANGKSINWENITYVSGDIKTEHYLKKGDVLFCARGNNNYSIVINDTNFNANAIAVSQFLIIEPDTLKLHPSYLAWYLSQKETTDYIRSNTLVSTVPLINKKTLEELILPLIPLERQNIIANIYELSRRENELIEKIQDLKSKMLNAIMLTAITGIKQNG